MLLTEGDGLVAQPAYLNTAAAGEHIGALAYVTEQQLGAVRAVLVPRQHEVAAQLSRSLQLRRGIAPVTADIRRRDPPAGGEVSLVGEGAPEACRPVGSLRGWRYGIIVVEGDDERRGSDKQREPGNQQRSGGAGRR